MGFSSESLGNCNGMGNMFRSQFVSLSICLCLSGCAGCGSTSTDYVHGGHLIELANRDDTQLEFVVDEEHRKLVVNVLESGSESPVAIQCEELDVMFRVNDEDVPVKLDIDRHSDDPPGHSSRFSIGFGQLPEALFGVADFTATFSLVIDGQTVSGTLEHKDDHTHH